MLQLLRLPQVIRIQVRQVLPPCLHDATVSRPCGASVLLHLDQTDPLLPGSFQVAFYDAHRVVLASVLHQEHLPVFKGLGADTVHGLLYELFDVIYRSDNAHHGVFFLHHRSNQ